MRHILPTDLYKLEEFLMTHGDTLNEKRTLNDFFKNVLFTYSFSTSDVENFNKVKGRLIKEALDKGVDINSHEFHISDETMKYHKEMLLNHPTNALSFKKYFSTGMYAQRYDSASYLFFDDIDKQRELILEVIGRGVKFSDHSHYLPYKVLIAHKELLLNQSSLTYESYVKKVLSAFSKYDASENENIEALKTIIEEAMHRHFDFSDDNLYIPFEVLKTQKDVFLHHPHSSLPPKDYVEALIKSLPSNSMYSHNVDSVCNADDYYENYYFVENTLNEIISDKDDISSMLSQYIFFSDGTFDKLFEKYGGRCELPKDDLPSQQFLEEGLYSFIEEPARILEYKYKNLYAEPEIEAKIPAIIHHIWLTHPSSPKEIRPQDTENLLKTKALFDNSTTDWTYVIWTNNKTLIPSSVSFSERNNIEVKSIQDYAHELESFPLISAFIEQKKWGMASDTLRYSLINKFGGVYADLNFMFNKELSHEIHSFDFFTMTYSTWNNDNFFFGAIAGHPILSETLCMIERNIFNPPPYFQKFNSSSREYTDAGTALPFNLAYYKKAHIEGRKDIIYPLTEKGIFGKKEELDSEDQWISSYCKHILSDHPDVKFENYFEKYEICGTDEQALGYDSTDGNTWLEA